MAPSAAQALLAKAEKRSESSTGWFSSTNSKFEEAGDLFQQAANAFKLEKLFKEAGDAFCKEAECREKCGEANDAANAWWNAAKSYKKGFPDLAVAALGSTIKHMTALGRFRQAADREKEIGQIHLQESHDLRKACESFERAAEWYAQEDAHATANACYKDAAALHAELDEFVQAIKLYHIVAKASLSSQLTKYSVREYWLRASLCAFATGETVLVKRNLREYDGLDNTFKATRESKFIVALLEAVEAADLQMFTDIVGDYDQVTPLDNWMTAILSKIKEGVRKGGDLDLV